MNLRFSAERAAQLLISLLKQHNIRKIIASPGATNITFVATAMHDPWFEIYSSVDERSAAYIACGLAEESGEPVVITCTGATASRNYMPGLTEAYYRKLPILAVTASQAYDKIGHMSPQLLDRSSVPNDVVRKSFQVRAVKDKDDEWADEIAINNAILELTRHGGGPVLLNFQTTYSSDYSVEEIAPARKITRVFPTSQEWPELPVGRICVFVGSHSRMSDEMTNAIDAFCRSHNAVVFCDHTSNYYGKFRVNTALVFDQKAYNSNLNDISLLIHIGEISGDYPTSSVKPKEVWRVSEDGEIRDLFRKLTAVFEMSDTEFFNHYVQPEVKANTLLDMCKKEYAELVSQIPELPFSNAWIASRTAHRIPGNSVVHLGILNSLRNWNYFLFPDGVRSNSNVGGFGIDGIVSTALGASLADSSKLFFAVLGDLAFFYDMNSIGNRHLPNNLRILLINNGKGTEFRNYNHPGAIFGEEADRFIAAAGHYGNKSHDLVRHYATDLGFEYLTASSKEEYEQNLDKFVSDKMTDKPLLFEVFTDSEDESDALRMMQHIKEDAVSKAKEFVRGALGDRGVKKVKSFLGKN